MRTVVWKETCQQAQQAPQSSSGAKLSTPCVLTNPEQNFHKPRNKLTLLPNATVLRSIRTSSNRSEHLYVDKHIQARKYPKTHFLIRNHDVDDPTTYHVIPTCLTSSPFCRRDPPMRRMKTGRLCRGAVPRSLAPMPSAPHKESLKPREERNESHLLVWLMCTVVVHPRCLAFGRHALLWRRGLCSVLTRVRG